MFGALKNFFIIEIGKKTFYGPSVWSTLPVGHQADIRKKKLGIKL